MTAPLTLAEVQALSGFTEGPWMPFRWTLDSAETVAAEVAQAARNSGGTDLHAAIKFVNDEWIYPAFTGNGPTSGPNAALVSAAPALHATCLHLFAEVARLTAELSKPVAHNARMAALLNKVADACDRSGDNRASVVCDALPGATWPETSVALRALAAGEVDDG